MALVWPASPDEIVTNQPRLHALIIGVARYPHLVGGGGAAALDALELGQVTIPAQTAPAIVDWLVNKYHNPACPLGSIELLLSCDGNAQAGFEPATMLAIEQAFHRWEGRCSTVQENIAFFYFCGHGLAAASQYLLPEDFGDPARLNRWQNCIDFDRMRVGMRACNAQTQLFFVDACRAPALGMLDQANVEGQSLITASVWNTVRCSATYYAANEGGKAYGPPHGATYFSQALLQCLDGLASMNSQGKWVVNTYTLSSALGNIMHNFAQRFDQPLSCNPDVNGSALIHEPGRATVLASIQCSSKGANAIADIELRRGASSFHATITDPKPLIAEVAPGDWEVVVQFPGGEYPSPVLQTHLLTPPLFEGVDVP